MRVLLLILLIISPLCVFSQQDPQYSQYLFNTVVINPAYAGSREYVNINALYRKQWVSVNGSPTSQLISVDAPAYNNSVGVGFYAYNDQLGAQFRKGAFASFAYRIKVSQRGRLALGASVGASQEGIDGDRLTTDQPDDPAVPTGRVSKVKPNLNLGLYFNTPRFFTGLSLADIVNNNDLNDLATVPQRRHLYLISGFVAPLSDKFKIRPSFLIKEDFKGPTNIDLTAFFIYNDFVWLGSSYRTGLFKKESMQGTVAKDAIVFMIQIFPITNLRIGYGYDYSLTEFKNFSTHEFSLGYNFNTNKGVRMLSPRYF